MSDPREPVTPRTGPGAARPEPARQLPARHADAAAMALAQVGEPYRYGGAAPGGFDCSGLVQYAYGLAGVALPRTTQAQWRELPRVAASDRRVGDLLFFRIDGRLSHVGLYLGGGQFVHAPRTGTRVRVERLDAPFYANRLVGVVRPSP
ncbi:MAG: C40 family peptidase [Pseudomonadota bacterium]